MTEERPDDLAPLGGAMRAEWQAEESELTRAAFEQWQHARGLVDLMAECAARGDILHLTAATATFRGPVVEVGPDRFTIAAGPGPVDVQVGPDLVLGIDRAANADVGDTPGLGIRFRARLLELETAGVTVVVGTRATEVRGRLQVGSDHVVVTQAELERVVPLGAIVWVRVDEDGVR